MEKINLKKNKRIMRVLTSFVLAFSLFLVPMNVNATVLVSVPYSEPAVGSNQGYMNLITYNSTADKYYVNTFYWSITPRADGYSGDGIQDSSSSATKMNMVIDPKAVTFTPSCGILNQQAVCTIFRISNGSDFSTVYRGAFTTTADVASISFSYPVVGFQLYGNFGLVTNNIDNDVDFTVLWGSEKVMFDKLAEISNSLADIILELQQSESLLQTYLPTLNQISLRLTHIDLDMDDLISLTQEILTELESIDNRLATSNTRLLNIYNELSEFHNDMINQTSTDKDTTDDFKEESDGQSNSLNDLNEQTDVDKIDVDNASGSVDDNLDVDVDANYGVLLSTFTENSNILTMLLAVASMGLISYVLFGKR